MSELFQSRKVVGSQRNLRGGTIPRTGEVVVLCSVGIQAAVQRNRNLAILYLELYRWWYYILWVYRLLYRGMLLTSYLSD